MNCNQIESRSKNNFVYELFPSSIVTTLFTWCRTLVYTFINWKQQQQPHELYSYQFCHLNKCWFNTFRLLLLLFCFQSTASFHMMDQLKKTICMYFFIIVSIPAKYKIYIYIYLSRPHTKGGIMNFFFLEKPRQVINAIKWVV